MKKTLIPALLFLAASAFARDFPPQKPEHPVPFELVDARANSLDDTWIYAQTIYDANINHPDLFEAYPVALEFSHGGRGFLGLLHTVFFTDNAGMSWANLDPSPPPNFSIEFSDLRNPGFISDMVMQPLFRPQANFDLVFISTLLGDGDEGTVRTLGWDDGDYTLFADSLMYVNRWLTNITMPDSQVIVAFSGLDGKIYRTDSIRSLPEDDSSGGIGTWDSLEYTFNNSWISDAISVGDTVIAVGSAHWRSEDQGETWEELSAADSLFDNSISYGPDHLHGIACGGQESSQTRGRICYTTDGGQSWSPRTWTSIDPIRAVKMVTDSLGFAVGGDYELGVGEILRTEDGGQTWTLDLATSAELRVISISRLSGAYVHVVTAGVYPDFSGAVWYTRIFLPDTSGSVLVTNPDTLNFGNLFPNTRDTLEVELSNIGSDTAIVITVSSNHSGFQPLCCTQLVYLEPQEDLTFGVIFRPDTVGVYSGELTIHNGNQDYVRVYCQGTAGITSVDPHVPIPEVSSLFIYPNPGNAQFQISFELSQTTNAAISIYDISGRKVVNLIRDKLAAGEHQISWNAEHIASGIYFVRLEAGASAMMKKLVLLK